MSLLRSALDVLVTGASEYVREAIFFIGLLLIGAGLAMVYVPAALIVPGAVLVWLAIPPVRGRQT